MWEKIIIEEMNKLYFIKMLVFLEQEMVTKEVYPKKNDWFKTFTLTPYDEVKVVIIGQDPYYQMNQANGLAFSTGEEKIPPSLKNIFQELQTDLKITKKTGDLTNWAKQGVLLLNTILTVEAGKPLSHKNIGWEHFTKRILTELSKKEHLVYILWGLNAQSYEAYVNNNSLIIKSAHPSPLSSYRGFFGSKPFSKTNDYLNKTKQNMIDWNK